MQFTRMTLLTSLSSIILSSLPSCAEADATRPQGPPKRTWAEAKEEIDQAFTVCRERVLHVTRKEPRVADFELTSGSLQRPGTSVMDIVVSRSPLGDARIRVVVLDTYIERDYDVKTGQASTFRIVRHVVKEEGVEMISEVEKYFKQKKLPYVIVDRKKPATRPGEKPKVSPAF